MDKWGGGRFNITKLEPLLAELNERLAGVIIERLPWREFIARYDHDGMLFYLDPPYWGNEGDYGDELFSREQFAEMADVLANIKGRFILSLNAVEQVRELFARFDIEEIDCKYSISHMGVKDVKELIISN